MRNSTYRIFMCFTRKFTVEEAEPPPDVKEAFRKYAGGGAHMTVEQLRCFLVEVQGEAEEEAAAAAEQILQKRHRIAKFGCLGFTLEDFYHYLFSTELNPLIHSKVHHDMRAPLSHYFIYTGHNSYLTGNQLTSVCSDVPIIKSLNKGVRAIELDLWPNSTKDDVRVLHGRTATTPVDLMKCLKSIKENAFTASPYPVILTLEDHLTPHLRAKVAQMLSQTFGEMLFYPESDCLEEFPSPEELKYRIIISAKPPKEYLEALTVKENANDSRRGKDSDEEIWGKEPSFLTDYQADNDKSEGEISSPNQNYEANDSNQKVHPEREYERLISIHVGNKGELKEALKVEHGKVWRFSLREQAFEKVVESHGKDIVRFTQKNIIRVYPRGTRVNSSNYKPQIGWMYGAQMIAFNMQGYGRALWLMQGMFRANGGCGYVKKPDIIMKVGENNQVFDPKAKYPVKKILKVKVYMGDGWHMDFKQSHFNSYSPPDFYARVGIAGAPADKIMKKTKKKEYNWTPVWDQEFVFPLTVPELALLRIEVHEYDMSGKDKFAGQTCIPILELRTGIRAIPLYSRKGDTFNSVRLLMRFEIS